MTPRLRAIRNCFEGVIPSIIATADAAGEPNISYLSHVHLVDDDHVALSNQFFSKTAANVRETGRATVLVVDALTGEQYALDLRYETAVSEGDLFERMAAQLRATEGQHAAGAVMALRSADIYRVVDVQATPNPAELPPPPAPRRPVDSLGAAARLVAEIASEADPDAMLDRALGGLVELFGFPNAMVLTPDESGDHLTTLASRGYATAGVGSQIAFGQGAIGVAAATRRPVRLSDMSRGRRFVAAVNAVTAERERAIPFPALGEAQSQLAVPMATREAFFGVLFMESVERFAFSADDENALALVAGQVAANLRLAELESRNAAAVESNPSPAGQTGRDFVVRCHDFDGSLFIDGEYLIKGVPGRLLAHLLEVHAESGRRTFTNRELRLAPNLKLPDLKDNLEARLILLRRRLEERCAPVRLQRLGRGVIGLELQGSPRLERG